MHGRVAGVSRNPLGDELTADAVVGATSIYVDDGTDFDEDGGSVLVNGTVYAYSSMTYIGDSADEGDPAMLTLVAPLLAGAAEGDRVDVWDPALGEVAVEYVATLVPDSAVPGDPLEAEVDHRLVPLLAEGIRAKGSESVELARDGDDLCVKTILGKPAEIVGTIITGGLLRTAAEGDRVEIQSTAPDGGSDGGFITFIAGEVVVGSIYGVDLGAGIIYIEGPKVILAGDAEINGTLDAHGQLNADSGVDVFGGVTVHTGGMTIGGTVELNTLDGTGGLSYVMCGNDGVLSRGGSASDLNARLNDIEARLDALEAP